MGELKVGQRVRVTGRGAYRNEKGEISEISKNGERARLLLNSDWVMRFHPSGWTTGYIPIHRLEALDDE